MRKLIFVVLLGVISIQAYTEDVPFYPGTVIRFASLEEGREIITNRDDFISNLSPIDRRIRCQKMQPVSEADFLEFISNQVLAWQKRDEDRIKRTLTNISKKFERYTFALPEIIYFIRTTGQEEGDAYYTRQNAIVFPKNTISSSVLVHELFHIISRFNPDLRKDLYQIIGFYPCLNEIEPPESIVKWRITNPDAPIIDYYIIVDYQGESLKMVPILSSDSDYNGGSLFNYVNFSLMAIEERDNRHELSSDVEFPQIPFSVLLGSGLTSHEIFQNYKEQIGDNTKYVIHPDEILADNFDLFNQDGVRRIPTARVVIEMDAELTRSPVTEITLWNHY